MKLEERKLMEKVFNDEDVTKIITENNLSDQEIDLHLPTFISFYLKKLEFLDNQKKGIKCLKPELSYEDKFLGIDYVAYNQGKVDNTQNISLYSINLEQNSKIIVNDNRKEVLSYIKTFLKNVDSNKFSKGLYLYGKYGTGKSYIMQDLAQTLAYKGYSVVMAYYPDFIRRLKTLITTGGIEEIVNELKACDYLFLDDFGGESNSQFVRDEILLPILQYRMINKKPLFITSNLGEKEIKEHLAMSTKDTDLLKSVRIFERINSLCNFMELKDKNYR